MKHKIIFACLLLAHSLHAELFFGPTSPSNRLLVASNSAIIISAVLGDVNLGGFVNGQLVFAGSTHNIVLDLDETNPTRALAGPAELILNDSIVISYKAVQGNAIKTLVAAPGSARPVIDVTSGKSVRFFRPIVQGPVEVRRAPTSVTNGRIRGGEEFAGPVSLYFSGPSISSRSAVYSYYFTEDFLVVPELGLLQGGPGTFEITIQKSIDLTNWFPVVVQNTSTDTKAFYRLRIFK